MHNTNQNKDPGFIRDQVLRYIHAGMLPEAAHLALDTCLSCCFQEFSGTHNYAYDLTSLGAYNHQYRKLMQHWNKVLTLQVLDVHYEDMVNNTETTCRRIFGFLELDWEKQCLDFHTSRRLVTTASQHQVRRTVYKGSRSLGTLSGAHRTTARCHGEGPVIARYIMNICALLLLQLYKSNGRYVREYSIATIFYRRITA